MSLTAITLVFIHKIIFIQGSSAVEEVLAKGGNCAHAATHYEF